MFDNPQPKCRSRSNVILLIKLCDLALFVWYPDGRSANLDILGQDRIMAWTTADCEDLGVCISP
jgi:hypothetical protein